MAKEPKGKNGGESKAESAAGKGEASFQAKVVAQYIKDLSFENPSIEKLLDGNTESPNIKLEVSVNARRMGKPDLFESAIELRAEAVNKAGTIYIFECVYAGLFHVQSIPEQALEPFLLIQCPSLIFPYLRRLASDITREGGFPPLLIDPLDFAALYMQRQQSAADAASRPKS
jgi:preprotein translocase subunit SecB